MQYIVNSIAIILLIVSISTSYAQEKYKFPGSLPRNTAPDSIKTPQGVLPGQTSKPALTLPTPKPADTFDVVGIRLGMRFSEAVSIINAHMQVRDRIVVEPKNTNLRIVFASGNIFVSDNGAEIISVLHEPDINNDRIFAVGRFYFEDDGTFDAAQTISNLYDKYKIVLRNQNDGYYYQNAKNINENANTYACTLNPASIGSSFALYNEDGKSPDTNKLLNASLQSIGFRFEHFCHG